MPQIEIDKDRAQQYIEGVRREHLQTAALNDQKQDRLADQLANSDSDPNSWRTMTDKAAEFMADKACPAWDVNDGEKEMWSAALAETLDRYFPGALDGFDNWHPIAKLIGASAVIAAMRIDLNNGGFAPLHHKKGKDDGEREPDGRRLDIDIRQESERKDAGSYQTLGE